MFLHIFSIDQSTCKWTRLVWYNKQQKCTLENAWTEEEEKKEHQPNFYCLIDDFTIEKNEIHHIWMCDVKTASLFMVNVLDRNGSELFYCSIQIWFSFGHTCVRQWASA